MTNQTFDRFNERGRAIADLIVAEVKAKGIEARVGETYRDYGQNWMWETVLVGPEGNSYQALNPRQFEDMNSGDFNFAEVREIVAQAERLRR